MAESKQSAEFRSPRSRSQTAILRKHLYGPHTKKVEILHGIRNDTLGTPTSISPRISSAALFAQKRYFYTIGVEQTRREKKRSAAEWGQRAEERKEIRRATEENSVVITGRRDFPRCRGESRGRSFGNKRAGLALRAGIFMPPIA